MDRNKTVQDSGSGYEALHKTVIVSDGLKPNKVILPVIVIIMIIAVMCVYTYFQEKNTIKNAEQVTNQMAEYIAGNIANEMDYAKSSIKFASTTISQSMTSDTLENPAETITPMVENSPFDGIEYIRADGMNVMNIGEPFDASDRVYYIEGISGHTGVWNNYHPKTSKETLMNFYTPIYYQGDISGVLTGYIAATTQISPLFETKLYGHDIYGMMVDEYNMVICSTIGSEYEKDLSLDKFMDNMGATEDQKIKMRNTIKNATEVAATYEGTGEIGRICTVKIPETEWKVVIVVPQKSLKGIVNESTRGSVITIIVISLILIAYAAYVLWKNIKRHREIAIENAKLEEENRVFNEENKRAFKELSSIRDIIESAKMGTWRTELVDGEKPRMYADDTMKELLGILGKGRTPEETYNDWFDNITPQAVSSVLESIEKMKQGRFDENTYLWVHPNKGERYVRCGGTAQEIKGGFSISGYHYDVDDVVREDLAKVAMLEDALSEKNDYYDTLGTLAGVYNSMHVIDLVEDTIVEFNAKKSFKEFVDHRQGATKKIYDVISNVATEECKERALEYMDLKTLPDRMKNRKYISTQLISRRIGWFLAGFITMKADEEGRPVKVILTTQNIDEMKKQEERLIRNSKTDELTGLLNRRAYEEDIYAQDEVPESEHFISMALDVNGLKVTNDTLGHAAGDELLVGAGQCISKCFGSYGKVFRTGGDEFIAILTCDNEKMKEAVACFEETMSGWKGSLVDELSISYGYVSKEEEPEKSVRELGIIADKRMYEAKSDHYRKKGIDRRGHQDAHKALCELYSKVLKVNITDDSYRIVKMDKTEQTKEKGFSDKISSWFLEFADKGQIHPDDLKTYLEKTDIQFMRDHFAGKNTSLSLMYRRKYGDEFRHVMMEIIPAEDYSDNEQNLYLYVRNMER